LIIQVPADVRRLQDIFPTLDIRLAFEDETFYRGMEAATGLQQPKVY
jgi:hypothetical protein